MAQLASSTAQVAFVHVRRAARYAADPRAVEDIASTAKKTSHDLWQMIDQEIGQGPWARAFATASSTCC